jgi:translocation and assembly module TamB
LNGQGVDLDILGKLDWSAAPEAGFTAVIRQLDLSPWLPDWPVGSTIEGNFELSWSQHGLAIPVCQLTVSGTDLNIDLEADIDSGANVVNARLEWRNLDWPLTGTNAFFSSASGQLDVSGSIDQWTASGQLDMRLGEYPQGSFELRADGGRDKVHLSVPTGEVLGGSMSGEADISWSDTVVWKAVISVEEINPGAVFPQWPGLLNAKIAIDADGLEDATKIRIVELDGRIRGVPVYAHGAIRFSDSNLSFDQLEARTDQAVLTLDGDAAVPKGISMTFSGELPALLLSGASGSVEARGRYSSHEDGRVLELNLQALGLGWDEYQVEELSIHSHGAGPVPELQLDAADVSLAGILLDEVSLNLAPVGDKHRLGVNIAGENIAFSSTALMTPEHEERPFSGGWLVDFTDMTLAIKQTYIFSLVEPAKLDWSADPTTLSSLCLKETAGAKFCLNGEFMAGGGASLIADVSTVPVNYLQDLFDLEIQFGQLLEGHLEWHQLIGQAPTGGADFRITAGKIIDLEDNHLLVETSEGRFAFKLQNGNLESGMLDLEFPGTGFIDVDFEVLDIVDDGARTLKGRAFAQLEDIKVLGQLALPGVDQISGGFESSIQLGGTLTDPFFEGGFKFSDGVVEYAPIGLMLEDIEFEGQLDKLDRGSFKGGFRAGEGLGSINGQILFDDFENIQLQVNISGEQLLLLNTDQLKLRTETDIKVALSPGQLDINGNISIPSARFSPSNLLVGGVSDSEDLVIEPIAGEMEVAAEQGASSNRVYGDLEVSFGDDVLIEIPGVETTLGGSVIFSWDGDPMPLAQGRYELNGTVSIYGPTLQIVNGHISFPGVAADNPVLNIRAQRDIFGNTQIRSAGVQLIGTLKRPRLEAYTVPVTNEDRAWTILVTGTDFDQGQGVNGFDVGTYIAPRLFISYGISLFDDDNVISARYDLKKGFGIKVSSGQRETGVDVSYTIDK